MYKIRYNIFFICGMLALFTAGCNGDFQYPNIETGRFEYAGIDNKTFRFYRQETGGVYREVNAPKSGLGVLQPETFCDEDFCGLFFYGCGLHPELEKPYFSFNKGYVQGLVYFAPEEKVVPVSVQYKIYGDTLFFRDENGKLRIPLSKGGSSAVTNEIGVSWRIAVTSKYYTFDYQLLTKFLSEKEHLQQISNTYKLGIGDTIALCLLKDRYVRKPK